MDKADSGLAAARLHSDAPIGHKSGDFRENYQTMSSANRIMKRLERPMKWASPSFTDENSARGTKTVAGIIVVRPFQTTATRAGNRRDGKARKTVDRPFSSGKKSATIAIIGVDERANFWGASLLGRFSLRQTSSNFWFFYAPLITPSQNRRTPMQTMTIFWRTPATAAKATTMTTAHPLFRWISALAVAVAVVAVAPAPIEVSAQPNRGVAADIDKILQELKPLESDAFKQWERSAKVRELVALDVPEVVPHLLPMFDDVYVHFREEMEFLVAGTDRNRGRGLNDPNAIAAFIRLGFSDRNATIRRHVARTLGRMGGKDAVRARVADIDGHLRRERDDAVVTAIYEALARIGVTDSSALRNLESNADKHPAAIVAIAQMGKLDSVNRFERLLSDRNAIMRIAAIDAAAIGGRALKEAAEAGLTGRVTDYRIRIASTEALPAYHRVAPEAAVELGLVALKDTEWRVRVAAVEALMDMWDKRAIGPLIEQLATEQGRLRMDVFVALCLMTGRNFSLDAVQWRTWWNANRERFEMPRPPQRNEWGIDRGSVFDGGQQMTAAFFGIPVFSNRILFCFDVSGSMRDPAFPGSDMRKVDYAVDKLLTTTEGLTAEARLDVLLYRYYSGHPPTTEIQRAFDRLVPMNDANKRRIRQFIASCEPRGWGDFYSSFLVSINDADVDTVFFLSDGRPSRGPHVINDELLAELRKINRFRRVAIHTVLTAKAGERGTDPGLMRNISALTGGLFRQVDPATDR